MDAPACWLWLPLLKSEGGVERLVRYGNVLGVLLGRLLVFSVRSVLEATTNFVGGDVTFLDVGTERHLTDDCRTDEVRTADALRIGESIDVSGQVLGDVGADDGGTADSFHCLDSLLRRQLFYPLN